MTITWSGKLAKYLAGEDGFSGVVAHTGYGAVQIQLHAYSRSPFRGDRTQGTGAHAQVDWLRGLAFFGTAHRHPGNGL